MWLIKASVFWWYFRLIIEHELIASAIKAHNLQRELFMENHIKNIYYLLTFENKIWSLILIVKPKSKVYLSNWFGKFEFVGQNVKHGIAIMKQCFMRIWKWFYKRAEMNASKQKYPFAKDEWN